MNPRTDIVIVVMGHAGVGKSQLVNDLLGRNDSDSAKAQVSEGLSMKDGTVEVQSFIANPAYAESKGLVLQNRRLVVVDTPGFDKSLLNDDLEVMHKITTWMKDSYPDGGYVTGVIYLYDITQTTPAFKISEQIAKMLKELVGGEDLSSIALVTHKWDMLVVKEHGEKNQKILEAKVWNKVIDAHAKVFRSDSERSPWDIIEYLIEQGDRNKLRRLREELDNLINLVPNKGTGKKLRNNLNAVFEQLRPEWEGNIVAVDNVTEILRQIRALPFSERILMLFNGI